MKVFLIDQPNKQSTSLFNYNIYTEEEFAKLELRLSKTYRLRIVYSRAEVAKYLLSFDDVQLKVEGVLVGFGTVDLTTDSVIITFSTPIITGYDGELNRICTVHCGSMISCIGFNYIMSKPFEQFLM